jgi:hypothetical protein
MRIQHLVLATFVTGSLFACLAPAQAASLGKFTGIWAHTVPDCKAQLSGRLDKMDNATSSKYEVIGICDDGIDAFHQPVECAVSDVHGQSHSTAFSTACYVKDYPADARSPATIVTRGNNADAISIKIDTENYSLSGNYVRCSKTHHCQHDRSRLQEKPGR